jgi:putative component of membrane protein insertase Oxa1/YidC/SpoIIIJ protein YidD
MTMPYKLVAFLFWILVLGEGFSQSSVGKNPTTVQIFTQYSRNINQTELPYVNMYSEMMASPDEFNVSPMPFTPNLFQSMICLYQRYAVPSQSSKRCQFVPSCSRYAYMAIDGLGSARGLLYAFDRLYRCNNSAFGLYPFYRGYLFDPPYSIELSANTTDSQKVVAIHDTSFAAWLLTQKEWELAYNEYLSREFEQPSQDNRLRLGKLSLNRGLSERALAWLQKDSSTDGSYARAIAYFRLGQFYRCMQETELAFPQASSIDHRVASLWLGAFLQTSAKAQSDFLDHSLRAIDHFRGNGNITKDFKEIISSSGSSVLSLSLSVLIPGLGQASNGFLEDGIWALVFVGGFGYLTAHNINAKRYAESAAFGFGFALTYSANLHAAYQSPKRSLAIRINALLQVLRGIYDPYEIIQVK